MGEAFLASLCDCNLDPFTFIFSNAFNKIKCAMPLACFKLTFEFYSPGIDKKTVGLPVGSQVAPSQGFGYFFRTTILPSSCWTYVWQQRAPSNSGSAPWHCPHHMYNHSPFHCFQPALMQWTLVLTEWTVRIGSVNNSANIQFRPDCWAE